MKSARKITLTFRIIGSFILLSAILPLMFGIATYPDRKRILDSGISVSGKVIEVVQLPADHRIAAYAPQIEYEDHEGIRREFTGISTRDPQAYSIGDNVELLYNPEHPDEVQPKNLPFIWVAPAIGFGIAGLIIVLSLLVTFLGPLIFSMVTGPKRTGQQTGAGNSG